MEDNKQYDLDNSLNNLVVKSFKLPIEYLYEKEILSNDIVDDLELLNLKKDIKNNKCLYDYVFENKRLNNIDPCRN